MARNPTTIKFYSTKAQTPDDVNAAIADALADEQFASDVADRRILWTADGDRVTTYMRTTSTDE